MVNMLVSFPELLVPPLPWSLLSRAPSMFLDMEGVPLIFNFIFFKKGLPNVHSNCFSEATWCRIASPECQHLPGTALGLMCWLVLCLQPQGKSPVYAYIPHESGDGSLCSQQEEVYCLLWCNWGSDGALTVLERRYIAWANRETSETVSLNVSPLQFLVVILWTSNIVES